MIISWNWLKEYVVLDMPLAELQRRLMMAGLNHESTEEVGGDLAIDLEVTSNRPDCLGHLGIAREVAVLWDRQLKRPAAAPREATARVTDLAKVTLECPELCGRYTARVIRNVKIGPSPAWLARRLTTIGLKPINNVVDVTNYVLMECGQPLHAFDLARLKGAQIIVREGRPGEVLEAIDHKTYTIGPGVCVIADASRAVAIGGVMGGAESEVSETTKDVLIEAAQFDPLSIRTTARRLNLHSDSSYRFERGLDPEGVDWASRRCCELVLELAGGELAAGSIDVGRRPPKREPIVLRLAQLKRVLGIEIDQATVRRVLQALGNEERRADEREVEVLPPSWRRDLSREIDLIEEVARIHGYEAIPEDVSVPMATSSRTQLDRVLERVRHVLTATGFDEALTLSAVEEPWSNAFSPWATGPALIAQTPILRRADQLRRSLVPSLLGTRRTNETLANPVIELFEIAKVYLPRQGGLPCEELMLGMSGGGDYFAVKGVIEALLAALDPAAELRVEDWSDPFFTVGRGCRLSLGDTLLGFLGEVSAAGLKLFDLRGPTTVAELCVKQLAAIARLVPQYAELPAFPAMSRDINLDVPEAVRWADVAAAVRASGGETLEGLEFKEIYRDDALRGQGRKSVLFSLALRSRDATLTGHQADAIRDAVVAACSAKFGGVLRVGGG
ncbi:MAG TPA: phenylalanine--tRNA ligase subunit beta [Pirellulales bacterium]|nr:phenylalanine--tRNA ligase subunit beta [Pirellulales bacterium]